MWRLLLLILQMIVCATMSPFLVLPYFTCTTLQYSSNLCTVLKFDCCVSAMLVITLADINPCIITSNAYLLLIAVPYFLITSVLSECLSISFSSSPQIFLASYSTSFPSTSHSLSFSILIHLHLVVSFQNIMK